MKLKTSTIVLGTGVVVGLVVLWLAKDTKTEPEKKASDQKPPPLGTTAPPVYAPPGPYDAYVPRAPGFSSYHAPTAPPDYGGFASTLYPKPKA